MTNRADIGEAVLEALRRLRVDCIMSSPGSELGPIWEAVARQNQGGSGGPRFIDCWHETLAVDMAIGYSLGTERLQAVMLHAGAGLLQGAMGIMGATHWEVPLVVLSGESSSYGEDPDFDPGGQWLRNLSVVGGTQSLVAPITKWATHVSSPHAVYQSVVRAGEIAQRVPRGPTYLSIPYETMLAGWEAPDAVRDVAAPSPVQSATEDVAKVAGLLAESENPVVVAETLGASERGFEALARLAERMALGVFDGASSASANFDKTNGLYQGISPGRFSDDVDLVLAVRTRAPWYPTRNRPPAATVVSIDENSHRPHMAFQNLSADHYLEGDAAHTLEQLLGVLDTLPVDERKIATRRERLFAEHESLIETLRCRREETRGTVPIDPLWLIESLNRAVPEQAIYVDETTLHGGMIRSHLEWSGAKSYFTSRGGLGQGLGLALGLKLAAPERPVVALMGDGGLLYNPVVQSLGASRDYGLPILIVVFDNGRYAAMQWEHERSYPDGAAVKENAFRGLQIDAPDYGHLAAAFGAYGVRVESADALADTLADGLARLERGQTTIVDVALGR